MSLSTQPKVSLTSRMVKGVLAIEPLASFAKSRARTMMIQRAEAIGVPWRDNVQQLSDRNWTEDLAEIENPHLEYPSYYTTSFHAYPEGNLSWKAAWEVESAARAVHAKIWSEGDVNGDALLRQSYHEVLRAKITTAPKNILDLGCGIGMSTRSLQSIYPQARVTGVDLSPYFLAVGRYHDSQKGSNIEWLHAAAEQTNLLAQSFDLVSACLVFHELPSSAARAIVSEARRLLRPGGHLAIMDMNPHSEIFLKMPPYILTLLKSTEPYLDQYFALDIEREFIEAGFQTPSISINSPRHRTIIAQV